MLIYFYILTDQTLLNKSKHGQRGGRWEEEGEKGEKDCSAGREVINIAGNKGEKEGLKKNQRQCAILEVKNMEPVARNGFTKASYARSVNPYPAARI